MEGKKKKKLTFRSGDSNPRFSNNSRPLFDFFTEDKGDEIKSKKTSKIFSTLFQANCSSRPKLFYLQPCHGHQHYGPPFNTKRRVFGIQNVIRNFLFLSLQHCQKYWRNYENFEWISGIVHYCTDNYSHHLFCDRKIQC